MTKKKCILILAVGLLGTEIAWKIWKYMRKRISAVEEDKIIRRKELVEDDVNEVLMFTEDGKNCRDHANAQIPCNKSGGCPVGNFERIQWYLSGALYTLDVCMYIMTCDNLTRAIIKSHRQGARVRIILDCGMSEKPACNNQILHLQRAGIEIRMNKLHPSSLMHHKFAVIDGKFLLFGSTNWTMQAFYGNNDSIVVTSSKNCLEAYTKEFEKLWRDFDV